MFFSPLSVSVCIPNKRRKNTLTKHHGPDINLGWVADQAWVPDREGLVTVAVFRTRSPSLVFFSTVSDCVLVLRYDHFAQLLRELDVMLCPQVSQLLCSFYRIVLYTSLGKTKKPTDGRKGGTHAVISKNKHSSSACMIKIYCNFTAILRFSQYEHSTENECKSQAKPTE